DYVRAELSAPERERFERHYLCSTRRHRKVTFARSFLRDDAPVMPAPIMPTAAVPAVAPEKNPSPAPRRGWWAALLASLRAPRPALSYSFAAAALLLLLGGLWLASEVKRLRDEAGQLRAAREERERQTAGLQVELADGRRQGDELSTQLRREQEQLSQSEAEKERLEKELARLRQQNRSAEHSRGAAPSLAAFILSPGFRSGEGPDRLSVARGARHVRLQLNLNPGDEYPSYLVELRTAGGDPVWTSGAARKRAAGGERAVLVQIPARLLDAGEYELTLKGEAAPGRTEVLGYYYFTLLKK
ncbi:MAG: hypothetical protein ACRD68_18745, partial [Pyrinomonadaceae bacterium]